MRFIFSSPNDTHSIHFVESGNHSTVTILCYDNEEGETLLKPSLLISAAVVSIFDAVQILLLISKGAQSDETHTLTCDGVKVTSSLQWGTYHKVSISPTNDEEVSCVLPQHVQHSIGRLGAQYFCKQLTSILHSETFEDTSYASSPL